MESSGNSYLHKKFKKQLSYEPRRKNEIKIGPKQAEQNQEKKAVSLENGHQVNEASCRTDNTHTVPNTSTNLVYDSLNVSNDNSNVNAHGSTSKYDYSNVANDSLGYNPDSLNVNQSSISLESPVVTLQSHNISYVSNIHRYDVNFDTKFSCSDVVSNSHGQKSSILDTNYRYNYVKSDDNVSPEREQINQKIEKKIEETPVQPDKSTGGKYVCNYCNLACSKPSVLQKHIRAHTNERPYPCVSCGFSFKTRSNLYKHCRSRTHANRILGSKARAEVISDEQESNTSEVISSNEQHQSNEITERPLDYKAKLYKPRFHTASKLCYEQVSKENIEDENHLDHSDSGILSHHINELITKNNSKVNTNESYLRRNEYNSEYAQVPQRVLTRDNEGLKVADEPLNLTNKVRKRCKSEAVESKSLIKEILLKNLASDMQCPHCKMIFQTVTELELHKLRNCKGFVAPGEKLARSNSVNVASILTQNKNAFDSMPQMHAVFPLKSPGPFLGKTRLVESDKTKSFSFDDGLPNISMYPRAKEMITSKYLLVPSSLQSDIEKKAPVKLFGGEVKISENVSDNNRFQIENNNDGFEPGSNFMNYGGKTENRVIRNSFHSGGTVLQNKGNFDGDASNNVQNVLRMYDPSPNSPGLDLGKKRTAYNSTHTNERKKPPDLVITFSSEEMNTPSPSCMKFTNILDFSQNAVKLLTPNLKQPNLMIPGLPVPNKFTYPTPENSKPLKVEFDMDNLQNHTRCNYQEKILTPENSKLIHKKLNFPVQEIESQPSNMFNPMNIVVNGKVVRYVPGMPGPIIAESPVDSTYIRGNVSLTPVKMSSSLPRTPSEVEISMERESNAEENKRTSLLSASKLAKPPVMEKLEIKTTSPTKSFESNEIRSPVIKLSEMKSPLKVSQESKKFARPNSLALKPTSASMKQHHGLTPTLLNQILISPDTPRVAKKYVQQYLNGNYFSYLGLKSTTKPVYCTLNKTQPSYVPHFKKLSMYSEWRQQDTKTEKFYATGYDSRQKSSRYSIAGHKNSDLMAHSSYKYTEPESTKDKDENQKPTPISGGYECNDDYTYIRGRGRGRYVCEQCGIRCKKPSMLKKHIRTHSNDRPYTCSHCNFSFKTKGNLTKHMKSKAHTKNSTSVGSNSSTQQSGTPSSDSETDDSGMDSSDESTRQQEHEAAYGLLSLSQKSTHNITTNSFSPISTTTALVDQSPHQVKMDVANRIMNTEEIAFVTKTNYAKNKCLEQPTMLKLNIKDIAMNVPEERKSDEIDTMTMGLGKSSENRPLTYPYIMSDVVLDEPMSVSSENTDNSSRYETKSPEASEPKCITQFHVIQRYASNEKESTSKEVSREAMDATKNAPEVSFSKDRFGSTDYTSEKYERSVIVTQNMRIVNSSSYNSDKPAPSIKVNDSVIFNGTHKGMKRKLLEDIDIEYHAKIAKTDGAIDLSVNAIQKIPDASISSKLNSEGSEVYQNYEFSHKNSICEYRTFNEQLPQDLSPKESSKLSELGFKNNHSTQYPKVNGNVVILKNVGMSNEDSNDVNTNANYCIEPPKTLNADSPKLFGEFDNSAMETLADIATKQVKLEKNAMAKSVASEYLKLATKNECPVGENEMFQPMTKEVNDLIVKPEGSKSCTICSKSFSKPSQLRLHMNVHYLERPFRCEPCAVSFRTKGHLQKHERSASHHNKLSSSPAQSSSEPRPFKCIDCNIAFRIHGHLAKHLRSKMHIMKLECLAKIPFGLYAELERSNSLLTEINTADGDQCLDSLRTLAKKVFLNDPAKLKNLVKSPVVVEN